MMQPVASQRLAWHHKFMATERVHVSVPKDLHDVLRAQAEEYGVSLVGLLRMYTGQAIDPSLGGPGKSAGGEEFKNSATQQDPEVVKTREINAHLARAIAHARGDDPDLPPATKHISQWED